jgi:hypothetical protein
MRAIEADRRAEELQRANAQQPPTIEQHIDSIPGLSDHKRRFLKSHPEFVVDSFHINAMRAAYAVALQAGVPDDSPEMDQHLLAGVRRNIEHQRQRAAPLQQEPPPAPPRTSVPISAPVSRDIPMPSGERRPPAITLSREEREVAAISFPNLSPAQAEYQYFQNKKRMLEMKADGRIQGDR